MTYTKARGTFNNPGSKDHGDPRWFILDSADPNRVRVYYSEARRDKSFSDQKWHEEPNPNPKNWYNIEEEETVSEFKVGDRVKVEFEGTTNSGGPTVDGRYRVGAGEEFAWVLPTHITKITPSLPTKVGTVIDSHGFRFILTEFGWHATIDRIPYGQDEAFEQSRYAQDFTVVLEGK